MTHLYTGSSIIQHQILTHWFICWKATLVRVFWRCRTHSKMLVYMWVCSVPCSWVWFAHIVCTCWWDARMNCAADCKYLQWISPKFAIMPLKLAHKVYANSQISRGKSQFSIFKDKLQMKLIDFFISFGRKTINLFLCITQLGFCCVYFVFVAVNLQEVVAHYFMKFDIRVYLVALLCPMIMLNFLKNLKYLTPVSLFASILTVTGKFHRIFMFTLKANAFDVIIFILFCNFG